MVLYPQDNERLAATGTKIRDAFAAAGFTAVLQAVEDSLLPHLNAASILVLAADRGGDEFAKGPYREIRRACSGINYAGRLAAFFSNDSAPNAALADMLVPTEIDRSVPSLSNGESGIPDEETVSRWVEQVVHRYKEMMDERHV
jgi:hypothetical protein